MSFIYVVVLKYYELIFFYIHISVVSNTYVSDSEYIRLDFMVGHVLGEI